MVISAVNEDMSNPVAYHGQSSDGIDARSRTGFVSFRPGLLFLGFLFLMAWISGQDNRILAQNFKNPPKRITGTRDSHPRKTHCFAENSSFL